MPGLNKKVSEITAKDTEDVESEKPIHIFKEIESGLKINIDKERIKHSSSSIAFGVK